MAKKLADLNLKPENVLNVNVGVLGHVDSGKTSLVKALSTLLSTASLDKNPQSIQRGITLDLGFSAFLLPLPERLLASESVISEHDFRALQFTLVDCPGHASLIKTIIGGAQIIDMVILVVNVLKGIQTQTAECLVISEITTKNLIIVLNKVDLLPVEDREERIEACKKTIRTALKATKFAECPIIPTAAAVGGERIAAMSSTKRSGGGGGGVSSKTSDTLVEAATSTSSTEEHAVSANSPEKVNESAATAIAATAGSADSDTAGSVTGSGNVPNIGLDKLLNTITNTVELPKRLHEGPFFFSVDHCFPIKGQGTVITGTVLSGTVKVNDMVEFPLLKLERKVKSMQMFHKNVKIAKQGDRLGICLANFDAKLVERGVVATPGSVPAIHGAIALIQRIRYFKGDVASGSKLHVTIGHSTVLATVTFFGHKELYNQRPHRPAAIAETAESKSGTKANSSLVGGGGTVSSGSAGGLEGKSKGKKEEASVSGGIAATSLMTEDSWELPQLEFEWGRDFYWQDEMARGKGINKKSEKEDHLGNKFHEKEDAETVGAGGGGKVGSEFSTAEVSGPHVGGVQWCYLAFDQPVFTTMKSLLIASRLETENAKNCRIAFYGRILDKMSPSEMAHLRLFKMKVKYGTIARLGTSAFASIHAPKEANDGKQRYADVYGTDLFKKETDMKLFIGMKVVTTSGAVGVIDSSFGQSGQFKITFKADGGVLARVGERVFLQFKKYTHDSKKGNMVQDEECLYLSPEVIREAQEVFNDSRVKNKAPKKPKNKNKTAQPAPPTVVADTPAATATAAVSPSTTTPKVAVITKTAVPPPTPPVVQDTVANQATNISKGLAAVPTVAPYKPPSSSFILPSAVLSGTAAAATPVDPSASISSPTISSTDLSKAREGKVVKLKEVDTSTQTVLVILDGMFTPEEDVKKFIGKKLRIVNSGGEEPSGLIIGAFGKGGKCKATFPVGSVEESTLIQLVL